MLHFVITSCSYLRYNVLSTGKPYEIYIPGDMVTFEQHWKHNSWDEEILQRLPPLCQNAQPPPVTICKEYIAKVLAQGSL